MMRIKFMPFYIITIILLALLAAYFSIDRIAAYVFSKTYNLEISYKGVRHPAFNEILLKELSILDKKMGAGFFSGSGEVKLGRMIGFVFRDVHFIKKGKEAIASYDSITDLVAIPFNSSWAYKEISGRVAKSGGKIVLKDFLATGDKIKLSVNGVMYDDNTINADITIYFSNELMKKVPEEMIRVVLRDEEGGWKSLTVNLTGNYKAPSIQVSGKLFRLKIGVASQQ